MSAQRTAAKVHRRFWHAVHYLTFKHDADVMVGDQGQCPASLPSAMVEHDSARLCDGCRRSRHNGMHRPQVGDARFITDDCKASGQPFSRQILRNGHTATPPQQVSDGLLELRSRRTQDVGAVFRRVFRELLGDVPLIPDGGTNGNTLKAVLRASCRAVGAGEDLQPRFCGHTAPGCHAAVR